MARSLSLDGYELEFDSQIWELPSLRGGFRKAFKRVGKTNNYSQVMLNEQLRKHLKVFTLLIALLGCSISGHSWQREFEHPTSPEHDLGMSIITAVDDPTATVAAGTSLVNPYGKEVATASKVDMNGNIVWSFFYQTPQAKHQRILSIDYSVGDNGYIMVGYYQDIVTSLYHSLVIVIDMNGGLIWQKSYVELTVALKVLKTSNDQYLIGGFESQDLNENTWTREGVLMRTSSTGTVQWRRHFTTPVLSRPENIQNFVETIIELDNNEYYISGSVSAITTSFGVQTKVQKVLSAKVANNGTLMWNQSFGSAYTSTPTTLSTEFEVAADAVYDDQNQQIYLVTNSIDGAGDAIQTVYEIDQATGTKITKAIFVHGSLPAPEGWHCDQIALDGSDIRLYGHVTLYVDANNCITSKAYFPFDFVFDRNNPATNSMTIHKNNGRFYPLTYQGFIGLNVPSLTPGIIFPKVHTPEMAIRRMDGENPYTTLLSYGEGPDHGFELFDDFHGMPICETDYTSLESLTERPTVFIGISWTAPLTQTKSLAFQQNDANLSGVDCSIFNCPNQGPNETNAVGQLTGDAGLTIYPNPTAGNLVIEVGDEIQPGATVRLTDLLGKECLVAPLQKKLILDLGPIKQGTYIMTISNGNHVLYQKIIRE